MNGVDEGRDEMSDEEGDEIDGEGQIGRESRTQEQADSKGEREDHEATHVPFRDWCVQCVMGRGRTHHLARVPNQSQKNRLLRKTDIKTS